jgi:Tol biopolymer transport system component
VPQRSVSVRVDSAVGAGESFGFSLGAQNLTITQAAVAVVFGTTLAEGTAYAVSQSTGPRSCTLSTNASGTIGNADVLVSANCGSAVGSSQLSGELRAPRDVTAVLLNNGSDEVVVTVPAGPQAYGVQGFSFATPRPDGTAYAATISAATQGQRCSVYAGASGTMPVAAGVLKVGCEFSDDHVSRNSDSSVRASISTSADVVIGGGAGAEGRYVAFTSASAALAGGGAGFRQVFWRDRQTGETVLVSRDAAGQPGNNNSTAPALSADGLTLAFDSTASNLVAGDSNGVSDVFVWSAATRTLERASVGDGGTQANGGSFAPALSGNGAIVAFGSAASNLTPGVSGTSSVNLVRRDRNAGTNLLVSRSAAGQGVGGQFPALSEDGNRLAFWSISPQLTANDTNGLWDIFVYQHDTGSLRRVSLTDSGGERNGGTESAGRNVAPALSGNGRWLAYATTSSNIVAGDTNAAQDVFLVDLDAAGIAVRRISMAGGNQGNGDSPKAQGERPAISHDGRWVAFTTNASNFGAAADNVVLVDTGNGDVRVVSSGAGTVYRPTLSRNGAYVAFGANRALDTRFGETGLFAHFTGLDRAWWWID